MGYILNSLTDITLEWWDINRFWLGFSIGWFVCCITCMLLITLIKLGVKVL